LPLSHHLLVWRTKLSFQNKLLKEIKAIGLTTLYFAVCFGTMILLKKLVLVQYDIQFRGLSVALLGALVVAKVVIVMEHVSFGRWVRQRPVAVDITLRLLLYTCGTFIAFTLEKAFEERHEGGFGHALVKLFEQRDIHRVWAGTICVSGALLGFLVLSALRQHIGDRELKRLFFSMPVEDLEANQPATKEIKV
jgi:hypothetical protein